jgi:putative ABC transport system ATP-binding protein
MIKPMLTVEGLSYRPKGGGEILRQVTFNLLAGEVVWLTGPSGGGKSTLLRLLSGLIPPSGGQILFQGKPLGQWPPTRYRRLVALLLQVPVIIPGSIRDNLALPFQFRAAKSNRVPDGGQLMGMLRRMGMEELSLDMAAGELSVGQKQRLSLIRLLLMEPKVLLLDEPVAALDSESRALVEMEAGSFARKGGAVIMASHVEPGIGTCRPLRLSGGVLDGSA